MGTATSMKGTVVANNAVININVNDTLEGRALTTTGGITVNKITAAYTHWVAEALYLQGRPLLIFPTACYAIFTGSGR